MIFIADKLRRLRRAKEWTLEEVAEMTGQRLSEKATKKPRSFGFGAVVTGFFCRVYFVATLLSLEGSHSALLANIAL